MSSVLLQDAALRALKLANGRFEAALDLLTKQHLTSSSESPVQLNGISKVTNPSGKSHFIIISI